MSDAPLSNDQKARKCFHNLFMPGRECKEPATWKGKGTGNPTDRWTWCDKHVTDKPEYRERLT